MQFVIHGENVSISSSMRQQIEKKLSFLNKYLIIPNDTTARVVCKVLNRGVKVELTISTKIGLLRAEESSEDFYSALDLAIDKLDRQVRNQKARLISRHKDSLAQSFLNELVKDESGETDQVVRTKNIKADVMSLDEAIICMEMLSHSFFIYHDNESDKIAVVYKRYQGGYGLIEID